MSLESATVNCYTTPVWLKYTKDIEIFHLNVSISQVVEDEETGEFVLDSGEQLLRISPNSLTSRESNTVTYLSSAVTNISAPQEDADGEKLRIKSLVQGEASLFACEWWGSCALVFLNEPHVTFPLESDITYVPRANKVLSLALKRPKGQKVYVVAYQNNLVDQLDLIRHQRSSPTFKVMPLVSLFHKNQSNLQFLPGPYSTRSVLNIRLEQLAKVQLQFVHSFYHERYVYFVTNQVRHEDSRSFHVRVGRFDLEATDMNYVYQEVTLSCDCRNSKNFTIATAATVARVGSRSKFGEDQEALFIAFARPEFNSPNLYSANRARGAIIGAISLNRLSDAFKSISENCYPPGQLSKAEMASIPGEIKFARYLKSRNCYHGDILVIQYHKLTMRSVFRSNSFAITSMTTYVQNGWTVGILGDSHGRVMKAIVDFEEMKLSIFNRKFIPETPITDEDLKDLTDHRERFKVLANPITQGRFVYLAMDKLIVKFPLDSCGIHSCGECRSGVFDSLDCVWCGSKCTSSDQCPSEVTDSFTECQPVILKVSPSTGPKKGGTIISLRGENFGADSKFLRSVWMFQGNSSSKNWCKIKSWSSRLIAFSTNPVNDTSEPYTITVKRSPIYLTQNFSIEKAFTYVDPSVHGIAPTSGHIFGGSLVTIYGEHLDSGSSKQVTLGGTDCPIIKFNRTSITCLTRPFHDLSNNLNILVNQTSELNNQAVMVVVTIDSLAILSNLTFEYKVDATIEKYFPAEMPDSYFSRLFIVGTNFDLVNNPILMFPTLLVNERPIRVACNVYNQTLMLCDLSMLAMRIRPGKSPFALTFKRSSLQATSVVRAKVPLNINFQPEPVIASVRNILDLENPVVLMTGIALGGSFPMRIFGWVDATKKHIECPIIGRNHTALQCKLDLDSMNGTLNSTDFVYLYYTIGETTKPLGRVRYIPKEVPVQGEEDDRNFFDKYFLYLVWVLIVPLITFTCFASLLFAYTIQRRNNSDSITCSILKKRQMSFDHELHSKGTSSKMNNYLAECTVISTNCTVDLDPALISNLELSDKLIDAGLLVKGDLIGRGHFGHVYFGSYNKSDGSRLDVAIKTIQHATTSNDITSFFREADIMKDFDHPNVMSLLGFVLPEVAKSGECQPAVIIEPPMIVLPFMWNGDLLTYVRDEKKDLRVRELVKFTLDIACGMTYLSNKNFIHRDLAARNCMMDENLIVKVSDFGLSRNTQHGYYYSNASANTPLPFKWMSPEALRAGSFTTKCDVWSYGITCWEVMTRGHVPYLGVESYELESLLSKGYRLNRPDFCPDHLYTLWSQCWALEPSERPTFAQIVAQVKSFIEEKDSHECLCGSVRASQVSRNLTHGLYYNDSASPAQANTRQCNGDKDT